MATATVAPEKLRAITKEKRKLDKLYNSLVKNGASERSRDADRKRKSRAENSDVAIPQPADPARRAAAEADIYLWLPTYFPKKFYNPFTADQREMTEAVLYRSQHGGFQAIAAPRGGGKTTLAMYVILFCLLTGLLKFALIVAATGPKAKRILRNLKVELRNNELLAADYPEVCELVRWVAKAPQRANSVTVDGGHEVDMVWRDDHIILPTIEGSRASGAILCTTGITGDDIRGLNVNGIRPDIVLLDDVDTRESAESFDQTETRELTIEQDIAGLGGPGCRFAAVMLCTVINRQCLAFTFTDPRVKAAWRGKRYRLIANMPDREDLWSDYLALRLAGMEKGTDSDGREAHAFYLANREAMDAGADVTNPYNFNASSLPDGTQSQISALQFCYDKVADASKSGQDGWAHFATEYQNDPPLEEGPETTGLNATLIQTRLNGFGQRVVPMDAIALVAMADVGKYVCHWTVQAWSPGAIGAVIDYGVLEVHGTSKGIDDRQAIELAIKSALLRWRDELLSQPYCDPAGRPREINMVLVDSGDFTEAVYSFVREVGTPFRASKGWGGNYRQPAPSDHVIVGNHWNLSLQADAGLWLYNLDADHFKRYLHERLLTPTFNDNRTFRPGSLSLWSPSDKRQHHSFSQHLVAEEWREQFVPGKGLKRGFFKTNKNNHWLDASYMGCAAADMCGIRLLPRIADPISPTVYRPPAKPFSRTDDSWSIQPWSRA